MSNKSIDIRIENGNIHIEGFPNATRILKLPELPFGKRLADLRLHEYDLKFCQSAMQKYSVIRQNSADWLENNVYLIAILGKFFACFKPSKVRTSLNKNQVFGNNQDALNAFREIEALRDKNIMHDESPLATSTSCIVLSKNNKIIEIISLNMHAYFPDQAMIQNLNNLINETQSHIQSEIQNCLEECHNWLTTLSDNEIMDFPEVKIGWSSNAFDQKRSY